MIAPPVDLAPFGLAVGHATDAEVGTRCTVVAVRHAVGRDGVPGLADAR